MAAQLDEDVDGEQAVYVTFTLTDPVGATWPIEEVLVIRRRLRELVQPLVPETPLYVLFSPELRMPRRTRTTTPLRLD